jgi:hypothetical protein
MPLNKAIADRIRESKMTGESVVKLFDMLAQAPIPPGASGSFNLTWHKPGDVIAPGDLLPTLTFTLTAPGNDGNPNQSAVDDAARAAG